MSNSIKLTCGYKGTDFTRNYTISGVADSIASDKAGVKAKIKAINQSLAGGTSDGLDTTFRSNDFNAAESIGAFNQITAAQIIIQEVTELSLQEGE